jgi:hypothetical protein
MRNDNALSCSTSSIPWFMLPVNRRTIMRNSTSWLCLTLAVIGLTLCVNAPTVFAAEEREGQPPQRQAGVATPTQQPETTGMRSPRMWRCGLAHRCGFRLLKCALLVLFVCHILLAAWIFMDIRKLGQGNGIFIILALLAGFPAAILYALVRIGDKKQ